MKDDAVAPVIAAMLVLAIVVTVFSVWTAVALPSMKAESEIGHLHAVEQAFLRFSSDLSNAASLKQEMTASEPVPLGGGSVLFSSTTSSGTLRVDDESVPVYELIVINGSSRSSEDGRLVRFSYRPQGNFWQDQGYAWHFGYINVTKGHNVRGPDNAAMTSPLAYPGMGRINASAPLKKFAASLLGLSARPWYNSSGNCSEIAVSAVSFSPSPGEQFVSGNGDGILAASVSVNETVFGVPEISSPARLIIRINRSVPDWFGDGLYASCNQSLYRFNQTYPLNVWHNADNSSPLYREVSIGPVDGRLAFAINRKMIQVNVSAV